MKWNRYTIKTTTEAVDLISCMLAELGIEGIEIQDNVQLTQEEAKTMFVDFIPELPPDDGTAKVNFYIDADEDDNTILGKVEEGLEELRTFVNVGDATVTESQTEDKDWINNWKQYWHTFTIGDLYIKPTWEPVTDEMKGHQVLSIDPGTAFGTGSHETTRLCTLALEKYIKEGDDVLDVGCGSGILSIVSVKYGAKYAVGIDIDEHAIPSTIDNRDINGVTNDQFKIMCGNIIDDTAIQEEIGFEKYDIAVANILAAVIIPLSGEIGQHIKPGGLFISSGIINTAAEDVKKSIISNGFTIIDTSTLGDWYCFVARKN